VIPPAKFGKRCGAHFLASAPTRLAWIPFLIVVIGASVLAGCSTARDRYVIGLVSGGQGMASNVAAFRSDVATQLADVGLEAVFIEVSPELPDLDEAIEDLLTKDLDVVVTWQTPPSVAVAQQIDSTDVPMVFGNVNDPVGAGLVTSLETPGGNITGVGGLFHHRRTIDLFQRVAGVESVLMIYEPSGAASPSILALDREMGADFNAEIVQVAVETDDALAKLLEAPPPSNSDGILLFGSPFLLRNQESLVAAATEWELPVAIGSGGAISDGALVFVNVLRDDVVHQMALKTVAISQGADPADMAVRGGALVTYLNLSVAAQLGISVPEDVLLVFDNVVPSTAGS